MQVGPFSRGERIATLNRLLEIEEELASTNKLAHWEPQTFPVITLPDTRPESENETTDVQKGDPTEKIDSIKK